MATFNGSNIGSRTAEQSDIQPGSSAYDTGGQVVTIDEEIEPKSFCGCCGGHEGEGPPKGDIIRLLMIGNGEVGKSTIIKQMQNLAIGSDPKYVMYSDDWSSVVRPYTEEERRSKKLLIHQNVLRIIGTLIEKVIEYGDEFDSSANRELADELMRSIGETSMLASMFVDLDAKAAKDIGRLWRDSAIRRAWERRCDYLISDATPYFLNSERLTEMSSTDYIPTTDDILRARDPSQGANDYNFVMERNKFSFRDLGGQPVELGRLPLRINDWMKECQNEKNFIVYVASLADYNQKSPLHPEYTQLDASVRLLQILMDIKELKDTGFILFLNKSDIFREKLEKYNDLQTYFQEYMKPMKQSSRLHTIDDKYFEMAKQCVAKKFHDALTGTIRRDDPLYCRFTCATDKEGMKAIIAAVRMDILTDLIKLGNMP